MLILYMYEDNRKFLQQGLNILRENAVIFVRMQFQILIPWYLILLLFHSGKVLILSDSIWNPESKFDTNCILPV